MSQIADIQRSISAELQLLNERIAETLHSSNELMNRVVENYLKTKGKQIRPILVLLSARLFGDINDRVIASAAAVELLHNASLIHDDVVDETKIRRGAKTINGLWDNHIAVLVGDFFLSNALLQAISTDDPRIVASIANLGKLLSIGEIDQIYNARYHTISEAAYFEVISRKTASLFVSCVEVGGYAVNAPAADMEAMREYAELLGLCFQIKDDIFDYFSDDKIGKPTGNDLREGKITLPLIHALENVENPRREEVASLSRKEELDSDEINLLIDYAKENGGIDYAYDTMKRLRDKAVKVLDRLPAGSVRDSFVELIDYIIVREN